MEGFFFWFYFFIVLYLRSSSVAPPRKNRANVHLSSHPVATPPAWHPPLARVLHLPKLPPDLAFPVLHQQHHRLGRSPGLSRVKRRTQKPERFSLRAWQVWERVSVCYKYRRNSLVCTVQPSKRSSCSSNVWTTGEG